MALQICTVRYIGLFLEDPLDVPWPMVEYLAAQLGITGAWCVKRYVKRGKIAYEHSWEICRRFGYHKFLDRAWGRRFRRFLLWAAPGSTGTGARLGRAPARSAQVRWHTDRSRSVPHRQAAVLV
jgi:hypothetical protein